MYLSFCIKRRCVLFLFLLVFACQFLDRHTDLNAAVNPAAENRPGFELKISGTPFSGDLVVVNKKESEDANHLSFTVTAGERITIKEVNWGFLDRSGQTSWINTDGDRILNNSIDTSAAYEGRATVVVFYLIDGEGKNGRNDPYRTIFDCPVLILDLDMIVVPDELSINDEAVAGLSILPLSANDEPFVWTVEGDTNATLSEIETSGDLRFAKLNSKTTGGNGLIRAKHAQQFDEGTHVSFKVISLALTAADAAYSGDSMDVSASLAPSGRQLIWTIEGATDVKFVQPGGNVTELTTTETELEVDTGTYTGTFTLKVKDKVKQTIFDSKTITVVDANPSEVSFSGTKYHEVSKDGGTVDPYAAPHWQDTDLDGTGERKYPVAFTRNTKPKIAAKFKLSGSISNAAINIKATTNVAGMEIASTAATVSGDTVTLPATETTGAFTNKISLVDAFKVNWKIQVNDGDWHDLTASVNQVYITLGDPAGGVALYHTLVDIGCRSGQNKTTENDAVTAIYTEFEDLHVLRVDGFRMSYWKNFTPNPDPICFHTEGLLVNGDGTCGAWARFLEDIYHIQGISAAVHHKITTLDKGGGTGAGLYVKNWTFVRPTYRDDPGIPGQFNLDPHSAFYDHSVVVHNGRIYDPSYGSKFSPPNVLAKWEDNSVDFLVYDVRGVRAYMANQASPVVETQMSPSP